MGHHQRLPLKATVNLNLIGFTYELTPKDGQSFYISKITMVTKLVVVDIS